MAKIIVNNPRQVINGGAKKYYFKVKGLGGPKGDQGEKGDTGATGPQGPQGNAATVSVGSTTTLPVGYDATVTNAGSIYNAVLDFGIPQGPQGPQGAKGDKGDTGAKGDTGPRGPQGERGTNATVYIGTTSTLNPGTQATVYNSGTDSNAVLNFGIPRGEKGETGATGATGATGPAGQNFTPTIVDSLPATGNQSNLYLTPKNYTTGTATGNPITISLGEDAGQVTSAQLDGNTTQQTYSGKNLFNLNGDQQPNARCAGTINGQSITITSTTNATGYYAIVIPNSSELLGKTVTLSVGDITVSSDVETAGRILIYQTVSTKPNNVGNNIGGVDVRSAGSTTFTFPDSFQSGRDCFAVVLYVNARGIDTVVGEYSTYTNLQLELGSEATSYEPYVGGTASPNPDYPQAVNTVTGTQTITINGTDYPLDLGSIELCKLGDYQDYIYKDGEDWKIHKATAKIVLNGSENIELNTSSTNTTRVAMWNILTPSQSTFQPDVMLPLSGHFMGSFIWNEDKEGLYCQIRSIVFRANKSTIGTTAQSVKSWLVSNNVSVYYALATATDTTITDQTLIAQLEAVRNATLEASNTITNTAAGTNLAGDLELDYYEFDPHNRYNKWLWLDINNNYEQLGS